LGGDDLVTDGEEESGTDEANEPAEGSLRRA